MILTEDNGVAIAESVEIVHELSGPSELNVALSALEEAASSSLECDEVVILEWDATRLSGGGLTLTGFPSSPRFYRFEELGEFAGLPEKARSVYLVPLYSPEGKRLGAVAYLNLSGDFEAIYSEAVASYSTVAAMALWKAEELARRNRLVRQMRLAAEVIENLLPKRSRQFASYRFSGILEPAGTTGGDIFDYFLAGEGKVAFLLADATGKGLGPCMQVSQIRAYFRALASLMPLPAVAERLNSLLCKDLQSDRFITAVIGCLDLSRHQLTFVDAGHGLFLHRPSVGVCEVDRQSNLPFGVLPGAVYSESELSLGEGEAFILYTDGWVENLMSDGEEFGADRLKQALIGVELDGLGLERLFARFANVCRGETPRDDTTMLVVSRARESDQMFI